MRLIFILPCTREIYPILLDVLLVPPQDQDIQTFHGSLTSTDGKMISYFRKSQHVTLLNRAHFLILSRKIEKYGPFLSKWLTCTNTNSSYLELGSLTLNNGKLISYFIYIYLGIPVCLIWLIKEKYDLFRTKFLTCTKIKSVHLEYSWLTGFEKW